MKLWSCRFFLKPRQLCHIHTDICIYQRSYVVCSNTSLTFLPLEKNAIFRKGRNFHIFYSPHEMIKPVRCNQPYPSHLHIVIYTIIIRKIGLFFDIRKHVLKVYSLLKVGVQVSRWAPHSKVVFKSLALRYVKHALRVSVSIVKFLVVFRTSIIGVHNRETEIKTMFWFDNYAVLSQIWTWIQRPLS